MDHTRNLLSAWTKVKEDDGASMVEYALLIVLIAIIAIVAIQLVGGEVSEVFQTVADTFEGLNN